jgi:hypothetical protein
MSTILGRRYYVEILDHGVFVKDSSTPCDFSKIEPRFWKDCSVHVIVKHWPAKVDKSECPRCHRHTPRWYYSHGDVQEAVELCARLNRMDMNRWMQQVNEASVAKPDMKLEQNEVSAAAITLGADSVNLIT